MLLNAPGDEIFLLTRHGVILDLNETMAKRFGATVEELRGSIVYDLFPAEVAEGRRQKLAQVIRGGETV